MQKKFLIAFLILLSCTKAQDPYILSYIPHIQTLEKQDHKFCVDLKLAFNTKNNLQSKPYWRCRFSFAKYRLSVNPITAEQNRRNLEINDLITKISLKIAQVSEPMITIENRKMDNRQHKQCLVMGFVVETEDQAKADEYFSCRKALIEDQQLILPYGNLDYLKYQNHSYNIGFVIDSRVDAAIKLYNEMKAKYPTCVQYNLYGINFKKCAQAQDKSRQCISEIDRKKFKKEGEEKIACQKGAYLRFPDEMLKEDSSKQDIEKMNSRSAYYNQQSLAAIGLDGTLFTSEPEKSEEEKKKEKLARTQKINSKANLYDKFELTKLRQKYIFSCQTDAGKRVAEFVDGLKKYCEELAGFEMVGEE